ncbi:MAG: pyruvate ferredoxin oxidoreductase [Candidatus Pacebacteria bacterium]|nr:pyruvate ferredoxin oxidoreductase [Candidatus Paceibacterota bacterium]
MTKNTKKQKPILGSGHRACAGCGQMIAAMAVASGMSRDIIIANATGCLEVTTTPYPETAWGVPWIHSLFENAAAVASGIRAALNTKGDKKTKVIAQGGDGGTFDIGFGLVSGMWERGENILYIAYDTEAYSNTGIQASGATPISASTTTTPAGSNSLGSSQVKKDMIAIALAHGLNYVAQSTAGYPSDITNKVKKAISHSGPAYIQILSPCIPGWKIKPDEGLSMGQLAVQTGLYPLLEYENGVLVNKSVLGKNKKPVKDYLEPQGRFAHLFKDKKGKEQIKEIQKLADKNIERYGL